MLSNLLSPHTPPKQNFQIFSVGMHSGDNKEASPYTAIKPNDVMDFLGNPNILTI